MNTSQFLLSGNSGGNIIGVYTRAKVKGKLHSVGTKRKKIHFSREILSVVAPFFFFFNIYRIRGNNPVGRVGVAQEFSFFNLYDKDTILTYILWFIVMSFYCC